MKISSRKKNMLLTAICVWMAATSAFLLAPQLLSAQNTLTEKPAKPWWPTRVPADTSFIGNAGCVECHSSKAAGYQGNSMSRALEQVAHSPILMAHPSLKFQSAKFRYEITRRGAESFYTVTDGTTTATMPILYSFGQGKAGQTYLVKYEGAMYETRLSFYNEIQGLDITIGHNHAEPETFPDAIGRYLSPDETLQCFSCHATGSVQGNKLHLDKLTPGISCEACHGPGTQHVNLMKRERDAAKALQETETAEGRGNLERTRNGQSVISRTTGTAIFNPGRLSGDDLTQEFCASCHRGVEEVVSLPQQGGTNNVRFQPYRIFSSKCYSDDRRISCIGCHNPHEPLRQEATFYDAKCLNCHEAKAQNKVVCKAGKKQDCASCHMPKITLPGSHTTFTDHRIRIVRPGEPYPL